MKGHPLDTVRPCMLAWRTIRSLMHRPSDKTSGILKETAKRRAHKPVSPCHQDSVSHSPPDTHSSMPYESIDIICIAQNYSKDFLGDIGDFIIVHHPQQTLFPAWLRV